MSLPVSIQSMATSSSCSSNAIGKRILVENTDDRISKLSDDVLLFILKNLSTKEAIKTSVLSRRWENVWKDMRFLAFNMRNIVTFKMESIAMRSDFIAELLTKIINNHNGHLECCRIHHYSYQSKDSTMLKNWIQTLIHVKHTKALELINLLGHRKRARVLHLLPNTFSHPFLTSLSLSRYDFDIANAFNNCHNLLILRLDRICAEVDVFNNIIASCPNLKVLVLDITWYSRIGCLKIHNNNLKLLELACTYIERVEVTAPLLDIFSVHYIFVTAKNFVLEGPRLLQFNRKYWVIDEKMPYKINYNISRNAQEKENMGHEYAVSRYTKYLKKFTSFAVSVDLENPSEVDMLKEVFDALGGDLKKLEIFFKHDNIPKEEGDSSNKKWEEAKLFTNASFSVQVVWLYNLSTKDEFQLASHLVTQGIWMNKMMINMSLIPTNKKFGIETEVVKLMQLPRGNEDLSIECF